MKDAAAITANDAHISTDSEMRCSFSPKLAHSGCRAALYDPRVVLAILVLLIGIPIGLFMVLRPKDPEANETQ